MAGGSRTVRAAKVALVAAIGAAALGTGLAGGPAAAGTTGLQLNQIGTFDAPVYIANAPGAKRLLFVVEQTGRIEVLRRGHRVGHPFLDIRQRVLSGGERGLLSVAFAPNYRRSHRFYVYFTNRAGNNEVDEFKRSRRSSTRAFASTRRRVLLIRHPTDANHNGGQLQFGPDGLLYIGTGDGGCGNDCHDNARHRTTLLGKILRINPRKHHRSAYTVPKSNPYVGRRGRDEIYSYGLRNPWRFSFNSANGDLAIGDVGQESFEEIDYTTRAHARRANFGWPEYEGNQLDDPSRPGPDPPTKPIFTFPHPSGGCAAVIGGYVVHARDLPALAGRYLYTDLCNGAIFSLVPHPSPDVATGNQDTGLDVSGPTSFGEGVGGRIYVASQFGPVYHLTQGG
jgi:glucose/arabinose dehydrogenase